MLQSLTLVLATKTMAWFCSTIYEPSKLYTALKKGDRTLNCMFNTNDNWICDEQSLPGPVQVTSTNTNAYFFS